MAAWLTTPIELHSSREFECMDFSDEDCKYYMYRWRFWYEADLVYALSTIAFLMSVLGIFIIGYVVSQLLAFQRRPGPLIWQRTIAAVRYLSYRGFRVKSLRWNSAPVGLLLLAAVGAVFFFTMDLIPQPYYWPSLDWGGSPPLATRSGWMALACMPFIFATASKTNWITLVTGVTHEKLQVFHRWISYAFFILALMHTFPFIVYHIRMGDMVEQVTESATIFYWTGIVALVFQAWLTFASFSTFRNISYEFFKAAHLFSAVIFVVVFFWHCDHILTSWDYFIATAAVYVPCFIYTWLRTLVEFGRGQKAQLWVEENGFIKINVPINCDWVPGQHCFLRFRSFGLHAMTSHPFTICSLPSISSNEKSTMTFYVRHRGGLTARLFNHAIKHPGASVPVLIDGPYGGIDPHKFHNSDRLLVIAGGSGAGWILAFIEQFARSVLSRTNKDRAHDSHSSSGDDDGQPDNATHQLLTKPSSLRVILATRDTSTQRWFQKTVDSLLSKYSISGSLTDFDVRVYVTGEAEQHLNALQKSDDLERSESGSSAEKSSKHTDGHEPKSVQADRQSCPEERGRPHLPHIIQQEALASSETSQSLGIFVCGPSDMQHDVRNAVAKENLSIVKSPRSGGVYLHMEHFSWA